LPKNAPVELEILASTQESGDKFVQVEYGRDYKEINRNVSTYQSYLTKVDIFVPTDKLKRLSKAQED